LIAALIACSTGVIAANDRGAENMTLYGGNRGKVPFPHAQHQTVLVDCMVCHTYFPQETGSIKKRQADGELKKKQVMRQCTSCHRKTSKAGQKAGPTRCSTCHKR
jgi:hypothetical protein